MGYTNRILTMKWCDSHTKKLKYCSSDKFDEYNNKFCKTWSPVSELMNGTTISALAMLKNYLSDHPFIKYEIFEETVNFHQGVLPLVSFPNTESIKIYTMYTSQQIIAHGPNIP